MSGFEKAIAAYEAEADKLRDEIEQLKPIVIRLATEHRGGGHCFNLPEVVAMAQAAVGKRISDRVDIIRHAEAIVEFARLHHDEGLAGLLEDLIENAKSGEADEMVPPDGKGHD